MHFKVSTETPSLSNWIKLMCDSFPDAKITVYIYIGGGNFIIEAVLPVLKGGEVMTKQEKIREGIATRLEIAYNAGLSKRTCNSNEMARQAVAQLHSQGVVVKVDRKLPFVSSNYRLSQHGVYVFVSNEALNEQGYVVVEPLIKEE